MQEIRISAPIRVLDVFTRNINWLKYYLLVPTSEEHGVRMHGIYFFEVLNIK